ncbi:hypothetical protein HDU76_004367, partial [Blyttiomyces sp. JEL0837]
YPVLNPNTNGFTSAEIAINQDNITYTAINVKYNAFCAGHAQTADGKIIVVGGDAQDSNDTNGATFMVDGRNRVRLFDPSSGGNAAKSGVGAWDDTPTAMSSARWYPTVATLADGSQIIISGDTTNLDFDHLGENINPTYEYYPPKNDGRKWPLTLSILVWAYPHNLYPVVFQLPSGNVFLFVSNKTVLIDPQTQHIDESSVPDMPVMDHAPWIYPHTPTAFILPMYEKNNFTATVMICGGSKLSTKDASAMCWQITPETPGVPPVWKQMKDMPTARLMPDSALLPDGTVLMTNGASYGQAGGNAGQAHVGSEMQNYVDVYGDDITLVPPVNPLKADCWPTANKPCTLPYEFRIERFTPPYLNKGPRPVITQSPPSATYRSIIAISLDPTTQIIPDRVTLIRYTTTTHSTNTDQRFIEPILLSSNSSMVVFRVPPNGNIAPPGRWHVFVLSNGVPSVAASIIFNSGEVTTVPFTPLSAPTDVGKSGGTPGSKESGVPVRKESSGGGVLMMGYGFVLPYLAIIFGGLLVVL